jgi:hypothetical protein
MKSFIQVIQLKVLAGSSSAQETIKLPDGNVKFLAMFYKDVDAANTGFVRASITDSVGEEVVQMHSIKNYRDREADYHEGKMPVRFKGGSMYTVKIQATANFTTDFPVEVVFVYDPNQI